MASPSSKRRKLSPTASETGRDQSASPSRSPRRASYLSPTKASLARFNPNLLPKPDVTRHGRPESAGNSTSRPTSAGASRAAVGDTTSMNPSPAGTRAARPAVTGQGGPSPSNLGQQRLSYILGKAGGDDVQEEDTPTREIETFRRDNAHIPDVDMGIGRPSIGLDLPSARLNDRPFPNLAPTGRTRPNAPKEIGTPLRDSMEDALPRGLLFGTPSKRPSQGNLFPERAKSPAMEAAMVEEPAVQTATREEEVQEQEDLAAEEPGAEESEYPRKQKSVQTKEQIAKIRERDDLRQHLEALRKELNQYERLVQLPMEQIADRDIQQIVTLLSKDLEDDTTKSKPPPVSQILASFLPFAKAPPPSYDASVSDKPVASHQPVDLPNPLPFLRLFTSFTANSTIATSPTSDSHEHIIQTHTFSINSLSSILIATLVLGLSIPILEPSSPKITSVSVPRLSAWATAELGSFIREREADGDVGALTWSLQSYWDIAIKRAGCWHRCEEQFSQLFSATGEDVAADDQENMISARKNAKGKGKETKRGSVARKEMSRKDILRHIGRKSVLLRSNEVAFRVWWEIDFDWSGEGESRIRAEAAVPNTWNGVDDRNSLKRIPATFEKLVKQKGVFGAVTVMTGLLFP
ncbi:hypothetical protein K402DRAFT_453780 [Aulographum hederae CBS 113979]|uniref:Uncharacterized protein n=1 Tax=Aulographum hederae CBS 113979 TaxID=1176131 RepID=A0A6G1H264_9PEZI|nr:hypothetical protein K402DRAFT_453780 [Aulographum hederae CBS 113979]